MSKYTQCKCCFTLDFGDATRDDIGRCRKCQIYCPDTLIHCRRIIEINRITGELVVVDIAKTFCNDDNEEHSRCFNCYWVGFPCNGCLTELFKRKMKLSDVVRGSMTYEMYKIEQQIWKPHWDVVDAYDEFRENFSNDLIQNE
jgi:hypothetical protein